MVSDKIRVGCCGFRVSKKKYFQHFSLVEVQETFYDLPNLTKMEKWRRESPSEFEYTLKAWQVITHTKSSPTWKRIKTSLEGSLENYGFLKPTVENFKAWVKVLEIAEALKASTIVLQLPPRLELNESTYEAMSKFFSEIDRSGHFIAVEPRNKTWDENRGLMAKLFEKFNLIHCVDIFKRKPLDTGEAYYIRLHGLNGELNYKYKYTDEDLLRLKNMVLNLYDKGKRIYVLFNNVYMFEDALRFKKMLNELK